MKEGLWEEDEEREVRTGGEKVAEEITFLLRVEEKVSLDLGLEPAKLSLEDRLRGRGGGNDAVEGREGENLGKRSTKKKRKKGGKGRRR